MKSLSAITAKNPTNQIFPILITQQLLQFMFNKDFQASLPRKRLTTPRRIENCLPHRVKLTHDEKMRFTKGNELKLTHAELFSFFYFKSV